MTELCDSGTPKVRRPKRRSSGHFVGNGRIGHMSASNTRVAFSCFWRKTKPPDTELTEFRYDGNPQFVANIRPFLRKMAKLARPLPRAPGYSSRVYGIKRTRGAKNYGVPELWNSVISVSQFRCLGPFLRKMAKSARSPPQAPKFPIRVSGIKQNRGTPKWRSSGIIELRNSGGPSWGHWANLSDLAKLANPPPQAPSFCRASSAEHNC